MEEGSAGQRNSMHRQWPYRCVCVCVFSIPIDLQVLKSRSQDETQDCLPRDNSTLPFPVPTFPLQLPLPHSSPPHTDITGSDSPGENALLVWCVVRIGVEGKRHKWGASLNRKGFPFYRAHILFTVECPFLTGDLEPQMKLASYLVLTGAGHVNPC